MHPTFAPPAPVAPQLRLSCALPDTPSLPKVACNSQTGVTHQHEVIRTGNMSRGNCMRNCRAPHCAPEKSHVIPPGPHSPTAQKPWNTNDPISKPETSSRELRAKLQHLRPLAGRGATQARPEPNAPRLQHIRIGNKHPDSLITYPDAPSLPKVARNSPRTSSINSSKTAEYQRSHFKTGNILKGITCEIARQRPV